MSYPLVMSTVLEIKQAVKDLPQNDQRELAEWFEERLQITQSAAQLGRFYDEEDGGESQLISEA